MTANWDGERGGFDDFEMAIDSAKFGYNEQLAAVTGRDQKQLIFSGAVVLGDGKVFENNDQGFGIGEKFDISGDGESIVHESGDENKMLSYQTGMMTMVRAARACGAAEVLEARCGGDPLNLLRHASVWNGLKFRFQKVGPDATGKVMLNGKEIAEGSFKDRNTGETVIRRPLIPTEFLGEVGGASSGGASGGTGSAQTSTSNGNSQGEDLDALVKSLGKAEFMEKALRDFNMGIKDAEDMWDKANA